MGPKAAVSAAAQRRKKSEGPNPESQNIPSHQSLWYCTCSARPLFTCAPGLVLGLSPGICLNPKELLQVSFWISPSSLLSCYLDSHSLLLSRREFITACTAQLCILPRGCLLSCLGRASPVCATCLPPAPGFSAICCQNPPVCKLTARVLWAPALCSSRV